MPYIHDHKRYIKHTDKKDALQKPFLSEKQLTLIALACLIIAWIVINAIA